MNDWIILAGMAVAGAGLAYLALRRRNKPPAEEQTYTQPRRVVPQPATPAPRTYADLAVELLDAMPPEDIAELADKADAALDFGEPSLTVNALGLDGSSTAIVLPAAFLEDLLDAIVIRRPDLQEMIDAPRPPRDGARKRRLPPPLVSGLSHRVWLRYDDVAADRTERGVTIRRVLGREAPTHINGICHNRRAFRSFRLDRVVELRDEETGEVMTQQPAIARWAEELVAEHRNRPHD